MQKLTNIHVIRNPDSSIPGPIQGMISYPDFHFDNVYFKLAYVSTSANEKAGLHLLCHSVCLSVCLSVCMYVYMYVIELCRTPKR